MKYASTFWICLLSLVVSVPVAFGQKGPKYKEGEVLVKFKAQTSSRSVFASHATHGSRVAKNFRKTGLQLVKLKSGRLTREAIDLYKNDPNVAYAEPNYILHTCDVFPNDPGFDDLWSLHNTGQTGGSPEADIGASKAWEMSTGSSEVIVAVIDTGVDYNHEDLSVNMWRNDAELNGVVGVDDDGNGYIDDIYGIDAHNADTDPMDDHGHGTHCSGTIGAVGNNGIGVVGVNWNTKIMALKFLGVGGIGTVGEAIECLEYVIMMKQKGHNVRITSNSWGGADYCQALYDTIQAAEDENILFVAAAGNDSADTDFNPTYPSSYDLPSIVSVAACNHNDELASFSNWGVTSVDVAAPGQSILSCIPGNTYGYKSGTSMATPHVSGLAALILARVPFYTWDQVKSTILATVNPLTSLQGLTFTEGRINAELALQSVCTGTGDILLDRESYRPGTDIDISVLDVDLNNDSMVIEQYSDIITVTTAAGDQEANITLTETGSDSCVFTGSIPMEDADVVPGDGVLQVSCSMGDVITATYHDADDGTGNPAFPSNTGDTDCFPPVISSVTAEPNAAGTGTTIYWDTDEPSDSTIYFGESPDLGQANHAGLLVAQHGLSITEITPGIMYYYDCESTDRAGNTTRDDNGGSHYQFSVPCPADISVDPTSLSVSLYPDEVSARQFLIQNNGCELLNFTILEDISWLTVNPVAGSVDPDGTKIITVSFDAAFLDTGTHVETLNIDSNDPDEPSTGLPITMIVDNSPRIASVLPASGFNSGETQISISGSYFQEGAVATIYGGGPVLRGACDTPGYAEAVKVSGDYAFVADGASGLQIIDVSNPADPIIIGTCDTPDYAESLYVSGDFVFMADGASGLQVIDVSNPATPHIDGGCDTGDYASGVYVYGGHAYLTDKTSGLQVIDVSNPTRPYIVGSVDTPGVAVAVHVFGDHAYVADATSGLQVIDVSNPTMPYVVGSVDTPVSALDVHVYGNYAYVAGGISGLQVINVSNPANPFIVGSVDTPGGAFEVYVFANQALVADNFAGLQVIDISDPGNPFIAGSFDDTTTNSYMGVYVTADYVYVADFHLGLQVLDIGDLANPSIVGSCETRDDAGGVYVSGNQAYVTDRVGLQVIDVSDPSNPAVSGACNTPGIAFDVHVSGDYAYVADRESGLQVIDVTGPVTPYIVGSCDTPGSAYGVYVSGGYAYVADDASGLQVIDVSNPANPTIVGSCDTPNRAYDVYVSGDHAYVADEYSGLQVINVSNPATPHIVGSTGYMGEAWGIFVDGNYAYLADRSRGLRIIDVTDPGNPHIVKTLQTPDYTQNVYVSGGYAYVGGGRAGLQVIDVSNPANAKILGSCDTPGWAGRVHVSGNHVYVADGDGDGGLQVISGFVPCANVTRVSETQITATVPAGFVPGTYNVHVTNPDGGIGTTPNAFTVVDDLTPLTADFTANHTAGTAPLTVQFTDQSGGTVDTWSWNFGDQGISTNQNPTHVYDTAGDFTVTLTVIGPGGSDSEIKVDYIHVSVSGGSPVIDNIGNRICSPAEKIRIIGTGFGQTQGDSLVHVANKTFDRDSPRIKYWSDTLIRIKIPNYKCAWFKGKDYKKPRVWVTVGGVDSNTKRLKVQKPVTCR